MMEIRRCKGRLRNEGHHLAANIPPPAVKTLFFQLSVTPLFLIHLLEDFYSIAIITKVTMPKWGQLTVSPLFFLHFNF